MVYGLTSGNQFVEDTAAAVRGVVQLLPRVMLIILADDHAPAGNCGDAQKRPGSMNLAQLAGSKKTPPSDRFVTCTCWTR